MIEINPYWLLIIAAGLSYIATPVAIQIAKMYNLMTDTSTRQHPAHTHQGVIPRGGGIPIYIALLITSLYALPVSKILNGILITNGLLLIMGLLDDRYDLSPYLRFAGNIAIAVILVLFGLGIPFISNPFGGVIHLDAWRISFVLFEKHSLLVFADLLSIVWLVWMMNMVNWSKGVDGQLPGFVSITAFFLGLLSQRFVAHDIRAVTVMQLAFVVSGAYLGFLPYNFFPQRIMPGYGGGAMAGFLLGILSILSFGKVGTALLVLSIPMIDACYTLLRRISHGASPFKADWGHFHHRLIEIGWGKRRIAIFYWSVSLILGLSSLFLSGYEKLLAFVITGLALIFFMFLISKIQQTAN